MKKYFLLAALALAFSACVDEGDLEKIKGNPDDLQLKPEEPSVTGDAATIDQSVFNLLNLDYPGLEKVKAAYEGEDYYLAAYELLQYYRDRTDIINPDVVLMPSYNDLDKNMADQATGDGDFRFYVRNYSEDIGADGSKGTADDRYWSFAKEVTENQATTTVIDWDYDPYGGKEKEWKSQKHRLQWMLPQAKVYGATKDENYAEAWMTIVSSYMAAHTNHKDENGYVTFADASADEALPWSGLQTAERFTALISSFMYYVEAECMTPAWLTRFLVFLYDHEGNMYANPWEDYWTNIELAQQQAMLMGGIFLPEFKDAKKWLDDGVAKVSGQLVAGEGTGQFRTDGVLRDLDLSYHIGVVSNFINIYRVARLNNITLPGDYTSYLKNACLFVQDMIYPASPHYWVEGFNDTRAGRTQGSVLVKNLQEYNLMFPEGDFEYMATKGKSGSPRSTDLRLYDDAGFYVFRSGWKAEDMVLILKNNNDPDKKWHNQPDNGTIGLYRNGRRFMPDAGVSTYGSEKDADLNKFRAEFAATAMHSTMTKNKADVESRAGKCLASGKSTDGSIEYIVTENPSYSDLTHRRAIFFVEKEFFVIVDEGYGDAAVDNVVLSFMLSDWSKSEKNVIWDAADTEPFSAHTAYSDNNNMVFKTFTSGGVEAYRAEGNSGYYLNDVTTREEYNSVRNSRAMYRITVNKPAGKAARFITVIHPIGAASEFENLEISARFTDDQTGTFNPNGASAEVVVGSKTYNLIYTLN